MLNLIHNLNITENAEEIHNIKQNTHDQNNTHTHVQHKPVSLYLSVYLPLSHTHPQHTQTFCEFIYICIDKLTSKEEEAVLCGGAGDMV